MCTGWRLVSEFREPERKSPNSQLKSATGSDPVNLKKAESLLQIMPFPVNDALHCPLASDVNANKQIKKAISKIRSRNTTQVPLKASYGQAMLSKCIKL